MPNHVPSPASRNRFNDGTGTFALLYVAAHPVTALLEAAALHGSYATGFVSAPPPAQSWTVFRYEVVQPLSVVDFSDPTARALAPTTVQELTGDWIGYHHRQLWGLPAQQAGVRSGALIAPTQDLAKRIYSSSGVHAFLTPSAKSPVAANLVLFFGRLPRGAIQHSGTATVVL